MRTTKKQVKKAFTLVEMLIVIIIIGILAAALIPRLNGARSRANDTARRADLNQLSTAIISYQMERWSFYKSGTNALPVELLETELRNYGGIQSIPEDPSATSAFSWMGTIAAGKAGNYLYRTIVKNGIADGGYALMSIAETVGGANYVYCGTAQDITWGTSIDSIYLCDSIVQSWACNAATSGNNQCGYVKTATPTQLRYVVKY